MRKRFALCAAAAALSVAILAGQTTPALRITAPPPDAIVTGTTLVEARIEPWVPGASISFTVNGRLLCTVERPPFRCRWNPGPAPRKHHVRAVAHLPNGTSLVANVFTQDVRYAFETRVDAIQVPVIVTDRGRFVRGLTRSDFEILEDGVAQSVASVISEESPLELVMAMDVSGSMEPVVDDVKVAVKQFLNKLRPGDVSTLVGFNDSLFIAAEREADPAARAAAVDLLAAWGGTAIYDATVRVLDMVSRETGRKGVVIFSDGADKNSMTTKEAATVRVQASDAMLYAIGFGEGVTSPILRQSLEDYAESTGGRAFFPRQTSDLDRVFDDIIADLANQYVLSYSPTNTKQDNTWRNIRVKVRKGKFAVRARRGYLAQAPGRGGR